MIKLNLKDQDESSRYLVWNIREEIRDTFTIVCSPHRFSKHHRNVNALQQIKNVQLDFNHKRENMSQMVTRSYLNAGTVFHVSILRDSVGDNNCFKASIVNPRDGRPREDTVCQNGIHSSSTSLQKPEGEKKTTLVNLTIFKKFCNILI